MSRWDVDARENPWEETRPPNPWLLPLTRSSPAMLFGPQLLPHPRSRSAFDAWTLTAGTAEHNSIEYRAAVTFLECRPCVPNSHQIWKNSPNFGRIWVEVGRHGAETRRPRPKSGETSQFGTNSASLGRSEHRLNSRCLRTIRGRIRPNSDKFNKHCQKSTNIGLESTNLGPN